MMAFMDKAIGGLFGHSENPVLRIGWGDSPQDVQSKLYGGWAVMAAARPESRREIEIMQGDATAALLAAAHAGDEALAAEWEGIFLLFGEILNLSKPAYEARCRRVDV